MTDRLAELSAAGVAVWLDDISRQRLATGGLDALRRDQHVVGVTSNPTIFAKALADSDDYAEQMHDLALRGVAVEEAARMITTYDVRWACDVMRPAYDASSGVDGRVSIEVDPRLAHETDRTVAEAKALWWLVDRPNLFIKIPATEAGLPAITETLAAGISVNVTLIFGLDRYEQVMDAFFAGLEQARANGHDLSEIGSVASFFVSRVDTEVDKRLEQARHAGGAGAAGQGRHRQRPARLPALRAGLRHRPLAGPGRRGRPPAASAVGVDLDQEPGLPRRACTSRSWSRPAWSTRCRRRPSHAFADHGEVKVGVVQSLVRAGPGGAGPARRRSASTTTT